jgi:hypothetical protein
MGELMKLRNIGPKSEEWLNKAGIYTLADLEALGAVEAWKRVHAIWPKANFAGVLGLQGALLNLHWQALPGPLEAELRQQWQAYRSL